MIGRQQAGGRGNVKSREEGGGGGGGAIPSMGHEKTQLDLWPARMKAIYLAEVQG